MAEAAKRVYHLKFDCNPFEARQQITSGSRAAGLRQLIDSLTDGELNALVAIKLESETVPERAEK